MVVHLYKVPMQFLYSILYHLLYPLLIAGQSTREVVRAPLSLGEAGCLVTLFHKCMVVERRFRSCHQFPSPSIQTWHVPFKPRPSHTIGNVACCLFALNTVWHALHYIRRLHNGRKSWNMNCSRHPVQVLGHARTPISEDVWMLLPPNQGHSSSPQRTSGCSRGSQ